MLLNLLEDSDTFEAAMYFVDGYGITITSSEQQRNNDAALILALDGLPSPTELAVVDTEPEGVEGAAKPSAKKKTKKTVTSKPKRPANYNSNRAREKQRKELRCLREKVVEMEQKLNALRSTRRPRALTEVEVGENNDENGVEVAVSSGFRALEVWKEMASHQLEQRLKSEGENRRLKTVLEGQIKIVKSLAKVLETTSNTKVGY